MRPIVLLLPLTLLATAAEGQQAAARGTRDTARTGREVHERTRVRIERDAPGAVRIVRYDAADENRAWLGLALGSTGSARDTLGVLIQQVTEDGPADKAGLAEGQRIQAINDVALRLTGADAEDVEMRGVPARRLLRELAKVKPGDTVALRIWENGQGRTVRVATSAPPERRSATRLREARENRAVLGLSVGSTGSVRDTLGLFVSRVAPQGPAERVGIVEGDRIQAINGTDVRVPREDAGDPLAAGIRARRFTRALRDAEVGEAVELRVWRAGQVRTVRVTTVAASTLADEGTRMFFFGDGAAAEVMAPAMPMAPGTPRAPMAPRRPHGAPEFRFEGGPGSVIEFELLRDRLRDLRPVMRRRGAGVEI